MRKKDRVIQSGFLTLCLLCFLNWPASAVAQTGGSGAYTLGPGDVIELKIMVAGKEETKVDLVVSEEEYVNVPFIGKVTTTGLSIGQLEDKILVPLAKDYFVNPQVYVTVKEYKSRQFSISGAVNKPGMFQMAFNPTLMDLIAKAGGLLPDRGDVAYVLGGNKGAYMSQMDLEAGLMNIKPVKIDLNRLLDRGDMSVNVRLKPGDSVYIPLAKKLSQETTNVFIEGNVKKPGVYEYQPGMTAFGLCILAGGFSQHAAPNRARIIRMIEDERQVIKIDLNDVKDGDIDDIQLKPGDRVHIPESWI